MTMHSHLANILTTLLTPLGPFSAMEYEASVGEPWDLYFRGHLLSFLSPEFFRTFEGYFLQELSYADMQVDELLDIYLVVKKMELSRAELHEQSFFAELGIERCQEGTEPIEKLVNQELEEDFNGEDDFFF